MELSRCVKILLEMRGIPVVLERKLWLVENTQRCGELSFLQSMATLSTQKRAPSLQEFLQAISSRHAKHLDAWALREWVHANGKVKAAEAEIQEAVEKGERSFRRFRGVDLQKELAASFALYERLSFLAPHAHQYLQEGQPPEISKEHWSAWEALFTLQLKSWGDWDGLRLPSPVMLCLEADSSMDGVLLEICHHSQEPSARILAALCLGARHQGSPSLQERWFGKLPSALRACYMAAFEGGLPLGLCFHAQLFEAGLSFSAELQLCPPKVRAVLSQVAERLSLFFGADITLKLVEQAARGFLRLQSRWLPIKPLQRFLSLFFYQETKPQAFPISKEEATFVKEMSEMELYPIKRANERLVVLFQRWLSLHKIDTVPLSTYRWERDFFEESERFFPSAAKLLVRDWQDRQRKAFDAFLPWNESLPSALLLWLLDPEAMLPFPVESLLANWRELLTVAIHLTKERRRELWPVLVKGFAKHPDLEADGSFWGLQLSPELLDRLFLQHGYWKFVSPSTLAMFSSPEQISQYLDCKELLEREEFADFEFDDVDLVQVIVHGDKKNTMLLFTLLQHIEQIGRKTFDDIQMFTMVFREKSPFLEGLLQRWADIKVLSPPPEFDKLCEWLGDEQLLCRYLHYRRLLGKDEVFSRKIIEFFEYEEKAQRTQRYLEEQLVSGDLVAREKEFFHQKLSHLASSAYQVSQEENAKRRTIRRLERAVARFEYESLMHLLDDAFVSQIKQFLGIKEIPSLVKMKDLKELFFLSFSLEKEAEPFKKLLLDMLLGRELALWPKNQAWLASFAKNGMDADGWRKGFSETFVWEGKTYRCETESSPFEAMKMGSYFGTCLSLSGGGYAEQALVCAWDINKHVIYIRNAKGYVVGRKLIACTSQGELLGYRLYLTKPTLRFGEEVFRCIERFAARVGVRLSCAGESEDLHGLGGFTDRCVPWETSPETSLSNGPHPFSGESEDDRKRWGFVKACMKQDEQSIWQEFHSLGESTFFLLLRILKGESTLPLSKQREYLREHGFLFFHSSGFTDGLSISMQCDWISSAWKNMDGREDFTSMMSDFVRSVPPRKQDVRKAMRFFEGFSTDLKRYYPTGFHDTYYYAYNISPCYTLAPFRELVEFVGKSDPYFQLALKSSFILRETMLASLQGWRLVFCVCYLREPDAKALRKALDHPIEYVQQLALDVIDFAEVTEAKSWLRQKVGKADFPHHTKLLCTLAKVGGTKDVDVVLDYLTDYPSELSIAMAVVRYGDDAQKAKARALYRPSQEILSSLEVLSDETFWNFTFLRSERFAKIFSREILRFILHLTTSWEKTGSVSQKEIAQLHEQLGRLASLGMDAPYRPRDIFRQALALKPQWEKYIPLAQLESLWTFSCEKVPLLYEAYEGSDVWAFVHAYEESSKALNDLPLKGFLLNDPLFSDRLLRGLLPKDGEERIWLLERWYHQAKDLSFFWMLSLEKETLSKEAQDRLLAWYEPGDTRLVGDIWAKSSEFSLFLAWLDGFSIDFSPEQSRHVLLSTMQWESNPVIWEFGPSKIMRCLSYDYVYGSEDERRRSLRILKMINHLDPHHLCFFFHVFFQYLPTKEIVFLVYELLEQYVLLEEEKHVFLKLFDADSFFLSETSLPFRVAFVECVVRRLPEALRNQVREMLETLSNEESYSQGASASLLYVLDLVESWPEGASVKEHSLLLQEVLPVLA
ncbi:MAG: hypothetical protein H6728_14170 [Myxococcales bacterium]|nr:hypothetical protein [Myxococcales bacterium]